MRIAVIVFWAASTCQVCAEEPPITLIDNSVGISQVVGLNSHGQIVGKKEIQDEPLGLSQIPYFYSEHGEARVEVLDKYTNIEPEALSDSGHVVGYVSRPIGHPDGSLQAFVWDSTTHGTTGLGMLPGDRGSHALDINSAGSIIVGYSTGADPARMVPCLWEKTDGGWGCASLQTIHPYNPVLLSSRVVVSDDGRQIAACITMRIVEGEIPIYLNALHVWQRLDNGRWERRHVRDGSYRLAGINNHGMLAGSCVVKGHRRGFVFDPADGFQLLELLEGDESGQALALNNEGTVVGFSDAPYGPVGGPQAFAWSRGKMSAIQFPMPTLYSSAQAINDRGQIGGYVETKPEAEDQPGGTVSFILSP